MIKFYCVVVDEVFITDFFRRGHLELVPNIMVYRYGCCYGTALNVTFFLFIPANFTVNDQTFVRVDTFVFGIVQHFFGDGYVLLIGHCGFWHTHIIKGYAILVRISFYGRLRSLKLHFAIRGFCPAKRFVKGGCHFYSGKAFF